MRDNPIGFCAVNAALLCVAVVACSTDERAGPPKPVTELCSGALYSGDVHVGHQTIEVSYQVPWQNTPRILTLHVWYPTSQSPQASDEHPRYVGLFPDEQSIENAPVAEPQKDCVSPVYAYSHGYQGFAGNSTGTTVDLIHAGWVVIAPDHTGNTLVDNDPALGFDLIRALDMQASLDAITATTAGSVVRGRVSTERVLLGGHSYGGQTAWIMSGPKLKTSSIEAKCAEAGVVCPDQLRQAYADWSGDARIAAIAALDGNLDDQLVDAVSLPARRTAPVLMLTATDSAGVRWAYDNSGKAVAWAWFREACHETFTSTFLECPGWPKEEGLVFVRRYLVAMGNTYVLQVPSEDDAALLSGRTVPSDRIVFSVRP